MSGSRGPETGEKLWYFIKDKEIGMVEADYWCHMKTLFLLRNIFNQKRNHSQLKDTTEYLDNSLQDLEKRQNVILNVK